MRLVLAATLISVIGVGSLAVPSCGAGPNEVLLENKWVGDIDKIEFREPSGIVYHQQRGTLFVAGDNGDLCEIATDGEPVRQRHVRNTHADFEGIAYDPSTGRVYVVVEEPPLLLEVDPDSLAVLREIPIERELDGQMVLASGGQGLEGVTFVPEDGHPHGGRFYVANQSFDLSSTDDVSAILELAVPLRDPGEISAVPVAVHPLGIIDLAGLHYDAAGERFLVVSDATNSISLVSLAGEVQSSMALPAQAQEGVTLDDEGHLYIAQGSGGIIKLVWLQE